LRRSVWVETDNVPYFQAFAGPRRPGHAIVKLHVHRPGAANVVTAYGPGWIEINAVRHDHPVLVVPDRPVEPWAPARFEALEAAHFESIGAFDPEVVLLGTGATQRFAHPRLLVALSARRIGVESMDTGAACRTYNILMAEGRRVLAALLPA
jgi:uncharacterized protein